jgi:hypothetical protein
VCIVHISTCCISIGYTVARTKGNVCQAFQQTFKEKDSGERVQIKSFRSGTWHSMSAYEGPAFLRPL